MQKQKVCKSGNEIFKRLVDQSLKISSDFDAVPFFKDFPGISTIRDEINAKIYLPLTDEHPGLCRKVILSGASGTGKTFLLKAICKEARIFLVNTKAADLHEAMRAARTAGGKCLVRIVDLDYVKDPSLLNSLATILSKSDQFVVAEIRSKIHFSLRKYGLFENEIRLETLHRLDVSQLVHFYVDYFRGLFPAIEVSPPALKHLVDHLQHSTPSAIAMNVRAAFSNAYFTGQNLEVTVMENIFVQTSDRVAFHDVGGLEEVKELLFTTIVHPLIHPQRYTDLGIKLTTGVLLHGPPGCGKTLLARAIATAANAHFIVVKGPELLSKYVGETEKKLREIFKTAKKKSPSIIFFDEVESLCSLRGRSEHGDRIVNQLLVLMDGYDFRGNVQIVGATNRIDQVDAAFLRYGRFDKVVEIHYPKLSERREIFLTKTKHITVLNEDFISLNTEGWTGADISGLVHDGLCEFLRKPQSDARIVPFDYFRAAYLKKNMNGC